MYILGRTQTWTQRELGHLQEEIGEVWEEQVQEFLEWHDGDSWLLEERWRRNSVKQQHPENIELNQFFYMLDISHSTTTNPHTLPWTSIHPPYVSTSDTSLPYCSQPPPQPPRELCRPLSSSSSVRVLPPVEILR